MKFVHPRESRLHPRGSSSHPLEDVVLSLGQSCILGKIVWRLSRISGNIRDGSVDPRGYPCILVRIRCILANVRGSSRMSVDILECRFGTLADVQSVQFLVTSILVSVPNRFASRFSISESRQETFSRVQTILARMQN